MLRFKMLARDVNSIPTQYRTWVVPNEPDFTGQFYTGLKSGPAPFVDVVAFAIDDDTVIADFDLPVPGQWNNGFPATTNAYPIQKFLPAAVEDSQLAIIDGYAYMFGGRLTNKIFRASLDNPADWFDTGATLPSALYGASLAIVGSTIYLFGGDDGYTPGKGPLNTIYSAPVSNPLDWTNTGASLPQPLLYSSLGMANGNLYLFGGLTPAGPTSAIYGATTTSPLVWSTAGNIPAPTYGASLAQVDGYWYMMGGQLSSDVATNVIWTSLVADPTFWFLDGYLPHATSFCQFFTMGNDGYLVGPALGAAPTGFTPILQTHLNTFHAWIDTKQTIPAVLSHSQLAIIYDRIWFFGGSGESAMFTCNQTIKYQFNNPIAIAYGNITRTVFQATNNQVNPFQALGFPYWITDYAF